MLIAFCKAMEFTALTKRVAEATKTDIDSVGPACPAKRRCRAEAEEGSRRRHRGGGAGASGLPAVFNAGDKRGAVTTDRRQRAGQGCCGSRRGGCGEAVRPQGIRDGDQHRRSSTAGSRRRASWAASPSTPRPRSLDPMQADIAGISLATEPGRAAYVPVGHREGRRRSSRRRAGRRADSDRRTRWRA